MFNVFFFVPTCALISFLPLLTPSATAESLDLITFNIRGDFDQGRATDKAEAWNSLSGKHRRELLLDVLLNSEFDVLGVQEAYQNQVEDLQDALPDFGFYGVGRDDGATAGEYSGIFFRKDRLKQLDQGTFWLSKTPDRAGSQHPDAACVRIASWLILADRETGDREYVVMNTHWDHVSQPARLHSAQVICDRIEKLANDRPVIVMGDLNVDEHDPAFQSLLESGGDALTDSYRQVHLERDDDEATFHGFEGGTRGNRIDFILTSDHFRATDAEIIRINFDGVYPSDHYPVRVTLEPVR